MVFSFSLLLYKALEKLIFSFLSAYQKSKELQRPEIYEHSRSSNFHSRFYEASFLEEISKHPTDRL